MTWLIEFASVDALSIADVIAFFVWIVAVDTGSLFVSDVHRDAGHSILRRGKF